jgi:hypothetical protein
VSLDEQLENIEATARHWPNHSPTLTTRIKRVVNRAAAVIPTPITDRYHKWRRMAEIVRELNRNDTTFDRANQLLDELSTGKDK